ncbi:MAG TPA: acyl-CoA dehydrogenase family protein, partial [Spirochaetota bacterium]|nr:acyl-CoA dehydrogenase family protein [Spirochaetota bacterium]
MDFSYSEEQQMLIKLIHDLGEREKFRDLAREIDKTCQFPFQLIPKYAELGLLGMTLSPEHGGGGQPLLNAIIAIEELAKYSPMIAAPVFESNVGPIKAIDILGSEFQKKKLIPGVCKGEYSVSVCMTEPEAGSDLTALRTNALEDGDSYVLNGRKAFITGGGHATHYLVYTRFDNIKGYKGIGSLIVEKGMEGFSFGKQEVYMGLHGMPSCDLFFDNVRVPKENVVLKPGEFNRLMATFHIERCGNAAMCLGIAGGALAEAKKYAMEREAFG